MLPEHTIVLHADDNQHTAVAFFDHPSKTFRAYFWRGGADAPKDHKNKTEQWHKTPDWQRSLAQVVKHPKDLVAAVTAPDIDTFKQQFREATSQHNMGTPDTYLNRLDAQRYARVTADPDQEPFLYAVQQLNQRTLEEVAQTESPDVLEHAARQYIQEFAQIMEVQERRDIPNSLKRSTIAGLAGVAIPRALDAGVQATQQALAHVDHPVARNLSHVDHNLVTMGIIGTAAITFVAHLTYKLHAALRDLD